MYKVGDKVRFKKGSGKEEFQLFNKAIERKLVGVIIEVRDDLKYPYKVKVPTEYSLEEYWILEEAEVYLNNLPFNFKGDRLCSD